MTDATRVEHDPAATVQTIRALGERSNVSRCVTAGGCVTGPPAEIEQMLGNPRSRVWRDEETGALLVGLNDFFVPAADAEEIPPSEVATVVAAWESLGWWGILAWVIQRRFVSPGAPPAARRAPTDAMIDAAQKEFLKVGEYEHASSAEQFRMALALKAALRAALAVAQP